MSDGTTTTTHEPINGGNGAICAVCAMRRPVMLEGFSVPIAIYTPAPWPCDAAKAEAENARLRERVAELDVMLGQACEAVNWLLDQDWPKDMDPGPGIRTDLAKWLAALAQAGEGGAA